MTAKNMAAHPEEKNIQKLSKEDFVQGKPTPTPWSFREKMSDITIFSNKKSICQINKNYKNIKANAAFIVRAVNLLGDIEEMSKKKCFCQNSGCLFCISKRVLKVFEAEAL